MGNKTGFHSGEAHAERMKCGDIYINERQFLNQEHFDTTYVSGTAATAGIFAGEGAQGMPVYKFTKDVNDQVAFRFIAPSSLKSGAKAQFRIYWTKTGASTAGTVNWDIEYWVTSVLVSGVEATGKNYNISGAVSHDGDVRTSTEYQQLSSQVSGVIQQTVVAIPSKDISANDLVRVQLSRNSYDTTEDVLDEDADLIGVLIEYVDG